jgi:hypothetical protein
MQSGDRVTLSKSVDVSYLLTIACLYGLLGSACSPVDTEQLRINQIQFVGSHNSYKLPMLADDAEALRARNPSAAIALDYSHAPIAEQLTHGLRKLEFDVFNDDVFPVGHVQSIDMQTVCANVAACLAKVKRWSDENPQHVPIWISFNLKDQVIEGLPIPQPFDAKSLDRFDQVLRLAVGDRLITPAAVKSDGELLWPTLRSSRGQLLLILDEGGAKREAYAGTWLDRPMFVNVESSHPAAGVMIVNDPVGNGDLISALVQAGYMVRTRADADTIEARENDVARRDAAFVSGAQAISTDYYYPFNNGYHVMIKDAVLCNPVSAPPNCVFRGEHVLDQ